MQSPLAKTPENETIPIELKILSAVAGYLDQWIDRLCAQADVLLQNYGSSGNKQTVTEDKRAA